MRCHSHKEPERQAHGSPGGVFMHTGPLTRTVAAGARGPQFAGRLRMLAL